jgi:hypothetical protein
MTPDGRLEGGGKDLVDILDERRPLSANDRNVFVAGARGGNGRASELVSRGFPGSCTFSQSGQF